MSFEVPEFWNFPPFFTIQPVSETQGKQLRLWKDLILRYFQSIKEYVMVVDSFPYFENKAINRKLTNDHRLLIVKYLIEQGNAEWEDPHHTRLRILWKTPEQLSSEIYSWASIHGHLNNIYTVFELINGDEFQDSGFHGTDYNVFRRSLVLLEKSNKCIIVEGSTEEEDGVKFI